MRRWLTILLVPSIVSIAALAVAQTSAMRSWRAMEATERLRTPHRLVVRASARGAGARVVVRHWVEGCTDRSRRPRFRARVDGQTIHVEREGTTRPLRCRPHRPHDPRTCRGPGGMQMECPRPLCRCGYGIQGDVSVPAPGRYEVVVADARRTARTTVEIPPDE